MPPVSPSHLHAAYEARRGDLTGLFATVAKAFPVHRALYPGSYIDISPSFVFPAVTYVDTDRAARRFFADSAGVAALAASRKRYRQPPEIAFLPADYTGPLDLPDDGFDLLVSLYAGFVSASCTRYLRPGGWLLANDSHGDASLAFLDPAYALVAVVQAQGEGGEDYRLVTEALPAYFAPKKPLPVTTESLRACGRGPAYNVSASAYVFQRDVRRH